MSSIIDPAQSMHDIVFDFRQFMLNRRNIKEKSFHFQPSVNKIKSAVYPPSRGQFHSDSFENSRKQRVAFVLSHDFLQLFCVLIFRRFSLQLSHFHIAVLVDDISLNSN